MALDYEVHRKSKHMKRNMAPRSLAALLVQGKRRRISLYQRKMENGPSVPSGSPALLWAFYKGTIARIMGSQSALSFLYGPRSQISSTLKFCFSKAPTQKVDISRASLDVCVVLCMLGLWVWDCVQAACTVPAYAFVDTAQMCL